MRGELPPALASIGRGSGLAGLVAAGGGLVALVAVGLPWHQATAELTMLGAAEDRAVATIAGWTTVFGPIAVVAGLAATVLGIALALDRHPGWTRPGLLTAAGGLASAGLLAHLVRPTMDRFPDRAGSLDEFRAVGGDLPLGVELHLSVRPALGATLVLAAGLVVLGAVAAARDLDRR